MGPRKNKTPRNNKHSVKVCKNGPYLVSGGIPLFEKIIHYDTKQDISQWQDGRLYPRQETYALCRCGQSRNTPFCDGTHLKVKFDGTETASRTSYHDEAVLIDGPGLKLTDAKKLCASARFCHRGGGIWKIITTSNNPGDKKIAIDIAADCPSGRLVVYDKQTGKPMEPVLEPSIVLIDDPYIKTYGPFWVRGGIQILSSDNKPFEIRNRVTLCRCGKSKNKPFCDSSHWPECKPLVK